jgi:hypothetical protein
VLSTAAVRRDSSVVSGPRLCGHVIEAQVADAERTTVEDAAQQFIAALPAKTNLEFATQLLASYQHIGIA